MTRVMSKPLIKEYEIDDCHVTFVQLTDGDVAAMGDLEGEREARYNADGTFRGYAQVINNRRSERRGIYRTMVNCDLQWAGEDEPVFKAKDDRVRFGMTENAFNTQWDLLAVDVAQSIVDKWLEHNPILTVGEAKATSKKSK